MLPIPSELIPALLLRTLLLGLLMGKGHGGVQRLRVVLGELEVPHGLQEHVVHPPAAEARCSSSGLLLLLHELPLLRSVGDAGVCGVFDQFGTLVHLAAFLVLHGLRNVPLHQQVFLLRVKLLLDWIWSLFGHFRSTSGKLKLRVQWLFEDLLLLL